MSIYLLFIDGIGLGEDGKNNPFTRSDFSGFGQWTGGDPWIQGSWSEIRGEESILFSVDANLEMEGLPQSGTGQATLFTGVNCAERAGKHFGPFPHSSSKPLLKRESLFHQWIQRGGSPHFINAYPERFFKETGRPRRWSCTTYMTVHSGLSLNREEDVRKGIALTAELDQNVWREKLGVDLPGISMSEAARRMVDCGRDYDLVMFEYFLTDRAGHRQEMEEALNVLKKLDRFLEELTVCMRREDTLVLCSDHGNLEDLSVRTHTRNRVPMAVWGAGVSSIRKAPTRLDDLPRLLFDISGREKPGT